MPYRPLEVAIASRISAEVTIGLLILSSELIREETIKSINSMTALRDELSRDAEAHKAYIYSLMS